MIDDAGKPVIRGIEGIVIWGLLLGAAVNLAAGVRRPGIEHRILARDHYAHADLAATAVNQRVPPSTPLQIIVYDDDLLGELDAGVWFDYRAKWLLYPRRLTVNRVSPQVPTDARPVPGESQVEAKKVPFKSGGYVLFFRASAPPVLPAIPMKRLATDPMWVLARLEVHAAGSGD